jgi:hypothetical protein
VHSKATKQTYARKVHQHSAHVSPVPKKGKYFNTCSQLTTIKPENQSIVGKGESAIYPQCLSPLLKKHNNEHLHTKARETNFIWKEAHHHCVPNLSSPYLRSMNSGHLHPYSYDNRCMFGVRMHCCTNKTLPSSSQYIPANAR